MQTPGLHAWVSSEAQPPGLLTLQPRPAGGVRPGGRHRREQIEKGLGSLGHRCHGRREILPCALSSHPSQQFKERGQEFKVGAVYLNPAVPPLQRQAVEAVTPEVKIKTSLLKPCVEVHTTPSYRSSRSDCRKRTGRAACVCARLCVCVHASVCVSTCWGGGNKKEGDFHILM